MVKINKLYPGTYTIKVESIIWHPCDIRNYTLGIYAADEIQIFNLYGKNTTNAANLNADRDAKLQEVKSLLNFSGQPKKVDNQDVRVIV